MDLYVHVGPVREFLLSHCFELGQIRHGRTLSGQGLAFEDVSKNFLPTIKPSIHLNNSMTLTNTRPIFRQDYYVFRKTVNYPLAR